MKITGNVRLKPDTNEMLREISAVRKKQLKQVNTNQDIVAELIAKAFKRECK
ncbi:unnamed protein product [marine sediment metagenome]|uniref:Uncharacterized protein n=1 Tax=marine sediment metagenome TaxID=412755 RepID=X1AR63_9ZZZZ